MLRLPARFATVILSFAPLFFQHSCQHSKVLLPAAILAPGKRTVTSLLLISGLARDVTFQKSPPTRHGRRPLPLRLTARVEIRWSCLMALKI